MRRCSQCGRFVAKDADYSLPFARLSPSGYYEEPEIEYYCDSCASNMWMIYHEKGYVPKRYVQAAWQRDLEAYFSYENETSRRIARESCAPRRRIATTNNQT